MSEDFERELELAGREIGAGPMSAPDYDDWGGWAALALGIAAVALLSWFLAWIAGPGIYGQPCEAYRDWPTKDVPFRCFEERMKTKVIEFRPKFGPNAEIPAEVKDAVFRGAQMGDTLQVQSRRHGLSHEQVYRSLADEYRSRLTAAFNNGVRVGRLTTTPPAAPVAMRRAA